MAKISEFNSSPSVFKKIPWRVSIYTFLTYMLIIGLFIFLINFIKVEDELELRNINGKNNNEIVLCLKDKDFKWDKYQVNSLKLVNIKKDETILIPYKSIKAIWKDNCLTFSINQTTNAEHFQKFKTADKQFLVVSFSVWNLLKFYYGI